MTHTNPRRPFLFQRVVERAPARDCEGLARYHAEHHGDEERIRERQDDAPSRDVSPAMLRGAGGLQLANELPTGLPQGFGRVVSVAKGFFNRLRFRDQLGV